jgi:hypothetical protein
MTTSSAAMASRAGSVGSSSSAARSSSSRATEGARRGHASGPLKPLDGLPIAGRSPDRLVGGHLGRRRLRSRQGPARLEVEGLTYREWEVRVHGLTNQFVMKGQALAGLAQHPCPKGLLDVGDQRRARPVEDRGEVGQRERRTEDRGDAKHLDRLHGQGLQLTENEQPE